MLDVPATLARIEQRFADGTIEHLDGVSVDFPDWHFNVRPSNTAPLLRLNLGATGEALIDPTVAARLLRTLSAPRAPGAGDGERLTRREREVRALGRQRPHVGQRAPEFLAGP